MEVPFVDLKAQYSIIKTEVRHALDSVLEDTAFIGGKYVSSFEEAYTEAYGVNHCVGVASGTDAIYITLKALDIGVGHEVITAANSWISTSETISQAGAIPVFVDIEPNHFTIDVSQIQSKITPKTKAIIPVHLYGQCAEIDSIKVICDKYGLYLIEDCAQAHFAEFKGKKAGTFGIAGTFSFYPGKNLGAYGDAGAIITNDEDLAHKIRMFANHGSIKKHDHQIEGVNSRLDGIQAAVLSVKLPHIQDWNRQRSEHACHYNKLLLETAGLIVPQVRENATHVFHLYVIRTKKRNALRDFLHSRGISNGIHYPRALPLLPAYRYLGYTPEDFPVASQYQSEILSLPMYAELSREQTEYVANSIREFLN